MPIQVEIVGTDWASWLQAGGTLLALAIAILLPRLDQIRQRRTFGDAAMEVSMRAHSVIAGVWLSCATEESLHEALLPGRLADGLNESERELRAFPFLGAGSAKAVTNMRTLADCCKGAHRVAHDPASNAAHKFEALDQIANFAQHLLILMAWDLGVPAPPSPPHDRGVPPYVLKDYQTQLAHRSRWRIFRLG